MGESGVVTGSGAQPGAISFVAGRGECEEKTVTLKIENFSEFLTMSNAELLENCLTFEAGTCVLQDGTRTAATWKYFFINTKEGEEDCVGGYLRLQNEKKTVKSAKASYSVTLSSGGETILSDATERREYTATPNWDWGFKKLIAKSEILQDTEETDTLDVSLQVKVFSSHCFKPVLQATQPSPSAPELERQVNSDLGTLLESGDGADLEIIVPSEFGGDVGVDAPSYKRKVHKTILMARSSVFSKMFAKESEMVEAKTGKVVIKDLSPQGLGVFLHYIYTGKVLDEWVKVPEEILNASEKYDLETLKQFCGRNLMSAVTTSNAWEMFHLAKLHNLSFAKGAIAEFVSKNARSVLDDGDEPAGDDTE